MAKPYLIFKVHNGIYYAQIRLADGTHANKKSTGGRNRAEAECKVMEWIVTGNIPVRVNSKDSKVQSIDRSDFSMIYGLQSLILMISTTSSRF